MELYDDEAVGMCDRTMKQSFWAGQHQRTTQPPGGTLCKSVLLAFESALVMLTMLAWQQQTEYCTCLPRCCATWDLASCTCKDASQADSVL